MDTSKFNKLAVYTPNGEVTIYNVGQKYSNGTIKGFIDQSGQGVSRVHVIVSNDDEQSIFMSIVGLPFTLIEEE